MDRIGLQAQGVSRGMRLAKSCPDRYTYDTFQPLEEIVHLVR